MVGLAALSYRIAVGNFGLFVELTAWPASILAAAGHFTFLMISMRKQGVPPESSEATMKGLLEISGRIQTPAADVVFVHGLQGDALGTWRTGADTSWPEWLAGDLPDVRVWSLGYDASPIRFGAAMSIRDRAVNAIAQLEARGLGSVPVVYVCHSLGGLLVKQMMRHGCDYPSQFAGRLRDATRGIVFLATPHSGSDAALWMDRLFGLLSGPLLKELRADTSQLRDLNQWYRNNAPKLSTRHQAHSETRGVGGIMIVDATSADPGIPDLIPIPMDEDHISISKPSSNESMLYLRVRAFVVSSTSPASGVTVPVAVDQGPLPEADLRRLLTQRLQRPDVAVIWFDTFGDTMDDFLPNQTLSQCVIALIDRVHKLEKQEALFQALATDRPDLTEDLRRLRGKGASST